MTDAILSTPGGSVVLPDPRLVLIDAADGGHLVVEPPRPVWDRSELDAGELVAWSFLVAATARAMLDVLPQLEGGCVNYWDAGNWNLNAAADPVGPKVGTRHRRLHMNLFGRSRAAADPSWRWGEAPKFPDYADRQRWAEGRRRLSAEECRPIAERARRLLRERYGVAEESIGSPRDR